VSQFTISYFDVPSSRGEECRLALTLAGVEFIDDRIAYKDWPARKASMPFGSVPVLTVAGKGQLAHSNAILNYIAAQFDLRPSEPWDRAIAEGVMESVEEMRIKIWETLRKGSTDEEKVAIRKEFAEGPLQTWATHLSAQVQGPFVSGELIFVADLKVWSIVQWFESGVIDHIPTDILAPFERLTGVHRAVAADPKIAAFRARYVK
jgi:prostaglandin-H2 D-isomerase / glutathione transferase